LNSKLSKGWTWPIAAETLAGASQLHSSSVRRATLNRPSS
jgi:hypothetical protein